MVQNERLAGIFEAFLLCHLKEMLMRLCFFKIHKKQQIHQIQQKAPPVLISSDGMLESLPLKQQRINKMMLWDLLVQASLASQSTESAVDVRCGALEARSSKVS